MPAGNYVVTEDASDNHGEVASEGGSAREIPLTSKIMESELVRVQATAPTLVTPNE